MNVAVAYTCVANGKLTLRFASRFVASYMESKPGKDHDTIIICNGGPVSTEVGVALSSMSPMYYPRSNNGWDIGGYIEASKNILSKYDLVVCLGESVYFHRPGWLKRITDCVSQFGEGMYGMLSSHVLRPHLGTTAFATSPRLLSAYPMQVNSKADRYEFEHGKRSFWKWNALSGKQTRLVTFDGCWLPGQWRIPSNILWKGDQSNCLIWCNHTDNYSNMPQTSKMFWRYHADRIAA